MRGQPFLSRPIHSDKENSFRCFAGARWSECNWTMPTHSVSHRNQREFICIFYSRIVLSEEVELGRNDNGTHWPTVNSRAFRAVNLFNVEMSVGESEKWGWKRAKWARRSLYLPEWRFLPRRHQTKKKSEKHEVRLSLLGIFFSRNFIYL